MFQANVYKIMIGAPSDIKEEIGIAEKVLQEWNIVNSETQNIVLLPLNWKRDAYPSLGSHPQKIINKQLVEKSDLLICIFGIRIGTQTDSSDSGTIEEINEHLNVGKQVMIFFKNSCSDIDNIDQEQFTKLKAFKELMQEKGLLGVFNEATDFEKVFSQKLQIFINAYFLKDKSEFQQIESSKPSLAENPLSEFDIEKLKEWTSEEYPQSSYESLLDGSKIYRLGSKIYTVSGGKEEAQWNDFFDKLLTLEFIYIEDYNRRGRPIYKLKTNAYDFIEQLKSRMT